MTSRILVTGSTGFLGRALIASLLAHKYPVTAFLRDSSTQSLIPPGVPIVRGDLNKMSRLREILERFDVVIHCAAEMDFAPKNVKHLYQVNVDGTATLAKTSSNAGVKHFIYISSTETIAPTLGDDPATEETEPNAIFEYGKSKILAEKEVAEICENSRMNYTIIRPTGILGAGDLATAYQMFWSINFGIFFFIPGSVMAKPGRVSYTHVSDIVKGISLAIENPKAYSQTFILSTNSMSYEAMIRHCATQLGRIQPFMYIPYSVVKTAVYLISPLTTFIFPKKFLYQPVMIDQLSTNRIYSSEKAKRELGWQPVYSMEDAISSTIAVQKNTGLLKSYTISPVAMILLVVMIIMLFQAIWLEF